MTIKNRTEKVEIETIYRDLGNWNYKSPVLKRVCTKPIAVIKINDDKFVFSHNDIFKILEAYLDVDERSMAMIINRDVDTGEVRKIDVSFIEKIKRWIKEHPNN